MIAIFRNGCHVAMSGQPMCFTGGDLEGMVRAYRSDVSPAPLVLGHPEGSAPVHGWVARLTLRGEVLMAEPVAVSEELRALVRAGRYRKVSASFWGPTAQENPAPGAYYLRHVGFLGAHPPAVKGLPDPEFGEPRACCPGLAVVSAVEFAGATGGGDFASGDAHRLVIPAEWSLDPAALAIHERAVAFQERNPGTDYVTAVERVL